MIVFHLPEKISTNAIYSASNWHIRDNHKKKFRKVLFVAQPITEFPIEIHFNFHLKGKQLDCTNLSYMAKLIEDCMVVKGILPDDSPKYVSKVVLQGTKAKENYCEIQIKKA